MPNSRFVVQVKTSNLRAEIWINRIPVAMLMPGEADDPVVIPVNEFIVPNRNVMAALVHAGPHAGRADQDWSADPAAASYSGPASLSAKVLQLGEKEMTHESKAPPLATLEWKGNAEPRPSTVDREFNAGAAFGHWAWERATAFPTIDAAIQAGALDYLAHLHGLIASGHIAEFVDASSLRLEEITVQAYGDSAGFMRQMLQQSLSEAAGESKLEPFERKPGELRLVAEGRMVDCLRGDHQHVLQFAGQDGPGLFLPVMIGQLDKEWRILR